MGKKCPPKFLVDVSIKTICARNACNVYHIKPKPAIVPKTVFQTILTEEEKAAFKPVCGNLRKGEASFHHALAVHGSYGNRLEFMVLLPHCLAILRYEINK